MTISEENVGNFLPDDAKILPELENGTTHSFIGCLVALQSTKGEVLKIKIYNIDPANDLLTVHPREGKSTEDYKDFYKKDISFTAEVVRVTMYKKPELILGDISLIQLTLQNGEFSL